MLAALALDLEHFAISSNFRARPGWPLGIGTFISIWCRCSFVVSGVKVSVILCCYRRAGKKKKKKIR